MTGIVPVCYQRLINEIKDISMLLFAGSHDRSDALQRSIDNRLLSKEVNGEHGILRIGYWLYKSRNPRYGIFGTVLNKQGDLTENSDVLIVLEMLKKSIAAIEQMHQDLTTNDLESKIIQLSYIDVAGAISALKGYGIKIIDQNSTIPEKIELEQLPLVLKLPSPPFESTGLVDQSEYDKAQLLQYLYVTFSKKVWRHFVSWLCTMNTHKAPSEMLVAQALRACLPQFLVVKHGSHDLEKFIVENADVSGVPELRLVG